MTSYHVALKFREGPLSMRELIALTKYVDTKSIEDAVALTMVRLQDQQLASLVLEATVDDFTIILERCMASLPQEPPPDIPDVYWK